MRRREFLLGGVISAAAKAADSGPASWTLENDLIAVTYTWSAEGRFRLASVQDKRTTRVWAAPGSAGAVLMGGTGSLNFGSATEYSVPSVTEERLDNGSRRLTFLLHPTEEAAEIALEVEVYPENPFFRQRWSYKNLSPRPVTLTSAGFLDIAFAVEGQTFRAFRVNQWSMEGDERKNFDPEQVELGALGKTWTIESGSFSRHCTWAALRDSRNDGLVLGWEFNGRAQTHLDHDLASGTLNIGGLIAGLNHPVAAGGVFRAPTAFLGSFRGDWDEAGYQTQQFVEKVLAAPLPDRQTFPYVAWDSWGYDDDINEGLLRRAADISARLGIELFTADLGWAARLGDWYGDSARFPSGMRALSDYVHARGMKFGLHLPILEADPASAVVRQNPSWTSSVSDGFYDAVSLCPGHEPARQWLIEEILRVVREYNVDWILLDGVNLVKVCTKRNHTHNARNSNYANSVFGFDEIVAAVRREAPQVSWENCQSGGRMMTYQMVRQCETSITCDDSGALTTRQAIYGATYPFPPRYTDRYLGQGRLTKYDLRSGMFGGPWMLMQRITEWTEADTNLAASEISLYKALRPLIRDGKVYHLTARPNGLRNEAIQAYNPRSNRSVIFVFRQDSPSDRMLVRPRGLRPGTEYRVQLQEAGTIQIATGRDLLIRGVEVSLPGSHTSEIILLTPNNVEEPSEVEV